MRRPLSGRSAVVAIGAGIALATPGEPLDPVPEGRRGQGAGAGPADRPAGMVIATFPDATLAAEAASRPELGAGMDGIVSVAPGFGLRAPAARILTRPRARLWVPVVAGREPCFEPVNERHARFWTGCDPTEALLAMAALARHAAGADRSGVSVPAPQAVDRGDGPVPKWSPATSSARR